MHAEVGRRVVRAIPPVAVGPARLLVDEAVGIAGRQAVVRDANAAPLLRALAPVPSPAVPPRAPLTPPLPRRDAAISRAGAA